METYISELENDQKAKSTRALGKKVDAIGWGVFFIWLGMAFLANVGWGAGLLGVGLIVLAAQLARKHFGLPLEWFSLIVGGAFVVWGVWDLLKIQLGGAPVAGNFLPMLFIAAGLVLVISALLRKGPQ